MGISCKACGRVERDEEALICSGCGVAFSESGSSKAPSEPEEEAAPEAEEAPEAAAPAREDAKAADAPAKPKRKAGAKKRDVPATKAVAPFCERCTAETSDENAGDVSEGFLFGRSFWLSSFGARPCETCGSEVRTLWNVIAGIPLAPIASYRYKTAEGTVEHRRWKFHSRRLPKLEQDQVRTTRIISFLMLLVVAGIIYWKSR